jgi:hypothetical protein
LQSLLLSFLAGATFVVVFTPQANADDLSRHYEKVSPADKGNGDIVGDGGSNVASRVGDAVTLSTRTPFGDTIGSGISGQTQYVVRRTSGGWAAHSITPQPRADAYQTFFGSTRFQAFSEDLRTAVVWGYDLPAATGDVPLRNNIYVEDLATRALRPVTMFENGLPDPLPHPIAELGSDANWGSSADGKHVAFVSRAGYLPEAAPGVPNVYQWDDGVLSLAGVLPPGLLPDGTVPPNGSDVVAQSELPPTNYRQAMSADGTRLVFTASLGGNSQLFQRIDGSRTAWVSETELDPSHPDYQPDPSGVQLRATTPDGRNVFFTTDSPLTSDDTNGVADVYRWTDSADPSADANLTKITPDSGFVGQVIGTSDDGERIYYQTMSSEIFVWDHGNTQLVVEGVDRPGAGEEHQRLGVDEWGPGYGRVSPDGRYLAFGSRSSTGVIGPTGEVTNGHREMYLYTLGDGLQCVSCPSVPAVHDATVAPRVTNGVIEYTLPGIRPRFLSDDGEVFFSTAEALVSEDVNGVEDAYEYDPATDEVRLISSGEGSDPASFVDASASGDDVFFVTRQRLVGSDKDGLVDLYDARIGDALDEAVEEPRPVCEGESCQPPPSGAPGEGSLGSLSFEDAEAGAGAAGLSVRRRAVLRGSVGLLRVRLSMAGRLTWRGRGLRSGTVRRTRSGAVVVRLRLTRRARARLRASGVFRTSVRLTLSSPGGRVSRTTRVTFRAAAKKGR